MIGTVPHPYNAGFNQGPQDPGYPMGEALPPMPPIPDAGRIEGDLFSPEAPVVHETALRIGSVATGPIATANRPVTGEQFLAQQHQTDQLFGRQHYAPNAVGQVRAASPEPIPTSTTPAAPKTTPRRRPRPSATQTEADDEYFGRLNGW